MKNLRSTFPLDEPAIRRKALGQILTDPITWAPMVPPVAAYTIFDVSSALSLGLGVLIGGGLSVYWRGQWASLTDGLRRQTIANHNRQQDETLLATIRELRGANESGLAQTLEQFAKKKRVIETHLHEDGEITPQKIQLEQLIDSLCFGVRDQLQAILRREQQGDEVNRAAILAQVDDAFRTLNATAVELDSIVGPSLPPANASDASLEEITSRLREETEIARRVQARLRAQDDRSAGPATGPSHLEAE